MANMQFANNAVTTLVSGITNVATSITVTSAVAFPTLTGAQYFYCTFIDAATGLVIEIVKVTAVVASVFTIVRAQDGTTASAYLTGDKVELRLTRASLNDFPKLDENNIFTEALTVTGHTTFEGVTSTGATGTGKLVYDTSPTLVTPLLGTPSSGTVTNLTGTASININGTVGATTPTTVVATTATANSFIPNSATIPTNGVYLPAANSVGIATNSTNRITLDASGNMGLGNTPSTKLDVSGTIQSTVAGGVCFSMVGGNNAIRDSTNGTSILYTDVSTGGATHGQFLWRSSNAFTTHMQLDTFGNLTTSGTISPQKATTAAAPGYVKGAIYFDTTLNKLRVGGATAWETITSV